MTLRLTWLVGIYWCLAVNITLAETADQQAEKTDEKEQKKFRAFTDHLTDAILTGEFTVDGREKGDRHQERYEIRRIKKLPRGDYWLFEARIAYGKHDLTLPIPLQVKWAGDTPVVTLNKVTLPGLGTFSARVLFHENYYAGTWHHGDVGGQMFGKITKDLKE